MSTTTMGRAARSDKAAKPGKTPKAGAQSAIQGQGRVGKVFGYAAMVAVLLVIAVPLFWIVVTSFKAHDHIYVRPAEYLPIPFTPENYSDVTTRIPFAAYFRNSVVITFFAAAIKIVLGVLSAYALSLLRFPGRNILFVVILAALMVPNQITIISNFALVAQLGWKNTFQGIIIPLCGTAFGTFLMRNQFMSLPHEIIEAARMDGAGPFKLLWRVVMPLSWPTLVAFSLITIVNEWNEYLWPFLMSDDERTAPLQVGLTMLQNNDGVTNWGPVMAGTVLTILPVLILFLVLQRQMIKGLTSGAVKS